MAASLPVFIKCNTEETIVEKAKCGFKVKNVNEMVEKLLYAYEHQNELKMMGNNGRSYVEQYHSWDHLSQTLIKAMYDDIKIKTYERE
jgi:glycosyltransferase involved in cell wall biosynthesis